MINLGNKITGKGLEIIGFKKCNGYYVFKGGFYIKPSLGDIWEIWNKSGSPKLYVLTLQNASSYIMEYYEGKPIIEQITYEYLEKLGFTYQPEKKIFEWHSIFGIESVRVELVGCGCPSMYRCKYKDLGESDLVRYVGTKTMFTEFLKEAGILEEIYFARKDEK